MGLMNFVTALFGGNRNIIKETAEVFMPNAENEAARGAVYQNAALGQFAGEFYQRKGWFNAFIDALNRIPRPAMALGTLALFISAMYDPIWFAERMQGLALAPEPLWWLLGAIVSFYFGAREMSKSRDFQKAIGATMSMVPQVVENIQRLRELHFDSPGMADTGTDTELAVAATTPSDNEAVRAWQEGTDPNAPDQSGALK